MGRGTRDAKTEAKKGLHVSCPSWPRLLFKKRPIDAVVCSMEPALSHFGLLLAATATKTLAYRTAPHGTRFAMLLSNLVPGTCRRHLRSEAEIVSVWSHGRRHCVDFLSYGERGCILLSQAITSLDTFDQYSKRVHSQCRSKLPRGYRTVSISGLFIDCRVPLQGKYSCVTYRKCRVQIRQTPQLIR
jgi:hypothetical protein